MQKQSQAKSGQTMIKQVTPEVLEEAIEWLETERYICHALPSALSGYSYTSHMCGEEFVVSAENFLRPLFKRDGIPTGGSWGIDDKKLPFTRSEWLSKIAQELREAAKTM